MRKTNYWFFAAVIVASGIIFQPLVGITDSSPPRTEADNSGKNVRDRQPAAVTADQQGWSDRDTDVTRKIRQNIVARSELSSYAHNVKVIAIDGVVTLKGPVRSEAEVDAIRQIAEAVVGPGKVRNEMQVAKSE